MTNKLITKFVDSDEELAQISKLSSVNQLANLTDGTKEKEGFVTWLYTIDILKTLHKISPSIIVKDGDQVVGYALVLLEESAEYYEPFRKTLEILSPVIYKNKPLSDYQYYFMGQICVDLDYRGQGIVNLLYQFHKEQLSPYYNFLVTEISVNNPRSQRAHEKVGFKTIYISEDETDRWNIVLWDWLA